MKYNIEEIKEKANYCLNCKTKPCKSGCPLQNNIPGFINHIKQGDYEKAFSILSETTIFEPICGRICPHKSQCEGSCIKGIKGESVHIGELETFVGDYILENKKDSKEKIFSNGKKVAIVGSGPAGIAVAYYLSNKGFKVSIYEKHEKIGGLLRYGIPEFRLNKQILDKWLEKYILNDNIEIINNTELGRDVTINELNKKYDYIILAFGANVSNKMNIDGEDFEFVLGGNELLEYKNMPDFKNKNVAIIGGGNVAIDSARTIKRLESKQVKIIYRRSEFEMPAEVKEIENAKKENIEFVYQTNILKIINENKPQIECIKTELIEQEGCSRKIPINISETNYLMDVDYVIMAVGSKVNLNVIQHLNLDTNKWGYIRVDENFKTSRENIYAVGDLIGTKQTVAWAANSGFECAKKITQIN